MQSGVRPGELQAALENVFEGQMLLEELKSLESDNESGANTPFLLDREDDWCTCDMPSSSAAAEQQPKGKEDATWQGCPLHRTTGSSSQRFESWEELEELCETMDGCSSGRIVEIDLTALLQDGSGSVEHQDSGLQASSGWDDLEILGQRGPEVTFQLAGGPPSPRTGDTVELI